MTVSTKTNKSSVDVSPKFKMLKSKDLMIRGRDFYAIWDEDRKMWSTDEDDVTRLVDRELDRYVAENEGRLEGTPVIKYMWDADSGSIDKFHKYCQKQMRDNFAVLDDELIFSNTELSRENFASKRLPYPLEPGDISAWDKLIGTLYSEEERRKIEWAIGSVVSGESKILQKFLVLYGAGGTGKSTIINIIEKLFEGYCCSFDAKALGNPNNVFALEPFKNNPLVAIQHDGDLSKIEDNTRLNSVISHEIMTMNEKFKGQYETRFKCFLFMGTNTPVKITDAKSGLLRRLIDVRPTGNKIPIREYRRLTKQVDFELGAIAYHCLQVFKEDPEYYDTYAPKDMLMASNDFYNFVCDSFSVFKKEDGTTLKAAWEMYKNYCEEAKVPYPFSKTKFKDELRNYFLEFDEKVEKEDGSKLLSYYDGFKTDIFEDSIGGKKKVKAEKPIGDEKTESWLIFEEQESIFDKECSDCPAQYATSKETPTKPWDEVSTTLSELDTSKLHYVKVPENHVVIDFDIKDENGNKCFEKNLEAASKWPPTYAELSKSGGGIHLHYIYNGDVSELSRIFDEDIEIKVFTGKTSLRRKLTKCVNLVIRTISSGLPLKEVKNVINFDGIKNEKYLRSVLKKHLNKEIMGNTAPSIQMIKKLLDEAYESGIGYDVSDMKNAVFALAASSSNQADECLKLVNQMAFKSEEASETSNEGDTDDLVFYDCEVFPNLFLVNYKFAGEGKTVVRLINPTPAEIENLLKFKLVDFNGRKYDRHIIYARLMGYTNEEIYKLSQRIINAPKGSRDNGMFGEAYNLGYIDVYDMSTVKQSLKKWEIELGIHHQELGLPWDQPVPEELWAKVAEYCDNDVIATEAVFNARKADFVARQIQVDLVKLLHDITNVTVNDTTNTLSKRIIFGNNKKPQNVFNYRYLAEPVSSDRYDEYRIKFGDDYDFRVFDSEGLPLYRSYVPGEKLPEGYSILPFFKGYTFEFGKSTYLGEAIGEGGRVYSEPGHYGNVWDGDIASQHPHSIIFECLFGPEYTKRFEDIVKARVAIKHKDFETAGQLLGGALKPYLNEEQAADLAQALKIVINSIYGLTSAGFVNEFRDPRNKDNIVAKRGALFMTLLKREVQKRGFTVCHIKTDSIKIPDATPDIIDFVTKFGKEYGYTFETEANFEKFCLVNDAVYVARFKDGKNAGEWTATGKQFAVPYVFKTLFSKEPIELKDMCEAFSVKSALYLDMNEKLPDVSEYEKELSKLEDKYRKGKLSDTTFESECRRLNDLIAEGHDYHFVGKVGQFCPVKPGKGGGLLMREQNGKYYAATGTTGFRWLESELMMSPGNEENIDRSYYRKLVDDALETIGQYGDAEWFISDDPYVGTPPWDASDRHEPPFRDSHLPDFMNIPEGSPEEIPFDDEDVELPWN
jgi:hypothetical protein